MKLDGGKLMANENVQVGKYTLESLTTGMYSDPKIVYREYIQNSVDSLEMAVANNLLEPQGMRIDIVINEEESTISIRDNGMGIPCVEAKETLMNVGNSKKRHSSNRGFRGIGRLGGMSYCDTLVFTTSAENEPQKTVVSFDCKKLRNLLIPGQYEDMTLSAVLSEITTVTIEPEKAEKHYFLVEMKDVSGFSDLLDIETAKSYISQVAPLPYQSRHFIYSSQLHSFLTERGYIIEEFPIFVGESESDLEPLYKPNRSRFHSDRNKMKVDEIHKMIYFDITIDNELYALGWYGDCDWYGSLSEHEISGFRVRKGNILIGDNKTLNGIFREARFNGWTQGELFILTDKLIPNARRDDFEQNQYYFKLLDALREGIGLDITRAIREASLARNDASSKVMRDVERKIGEATLILEEGFNSSVDKEKLLTELASTAEVLARTKPKDDAQAEQKQQLTHRIESAVEEVTESKKYKLNQVNSGIDKKSKKILSVVSDILSNKLSKFLVDEIIEEIIKELNGK